MQDPKPNSELQAFSFRPEIKSCATGEFLCGGDPALENSQKHFKLDNFKLLGTRLSFMISLSHRTHSS